VGYVTALALAARGGDRVARLLTARAGPDTVEVGLADGVLTDQVLARLGTDRRTAFVLTQLLGFDYAGAAEICGCPVGTIRSRVARAREQLVAELPSPRPIPSAAATPSPSAGSPVGNDRGAARARGDEAVDGQPTGPAAPAGPAGAAGSATRSAPRPRA
jgi:RNA polymerase sigma-70 factor (ECF subfamily)